MEIKQGNIVIKQHPVLDFLEISSSFRKVVKYTTSEMIIEPNLKCDPENFSHLIRIPASLLEHLGFEKLTTNERTYYKNSVFVRKESDVEYTIYTVRHPRKTIFCLYELQNLYTEFTNGDVLNVSDFNDWSRFYHHVNY